MTFYRIKFKHTSNDIVIQCDEWQTGTDNYFIEFYDYDEERDKNTVIAWYAKDLVVAIIPHVDRIKETYNDV